MNDHQSPMSNGPDDLEDWFNELDDKSIEIITNNLVKEEELSSVENNEVKLTNESSDTEYIYIEDILNINMNDLNSNDLIQYQCSVAYFIQVLIEGTSINRIKTLKTHDKELTKDKITDVIQYLKWISNACTILASRINQEILTYTPNKNTCVPSIIRSSYNFCNKYTQCKNFYSKHEIPTCKEHHYVHSLLKYDIESVINFLKFVVEHDVDMSKEHLTDLYLSIKTVCFVSRHMAKEINYIHYITKNNSETFHRNNPMEISRKKNFIKKPRINTSKVQPNKKVNKYENKVVKNKSGGFNNVNDTTINKQPEVSNRYSILTEF